MIEHICISNEAVSLYSLNLYTKDAAGHHHSNLRVLSDGKLGELGNLFADQIIVRLDVNDLLFDLIKEWTTFKLFLLFICEEDREVGVILWENVNVVLPVRLRLASLLHHECAEESMLRRYKPLS